MNGVIALDIDGTTTIPGSPIPQDVINYLQQLVHDQWLILFVTGRSFYGSQFSLAVLPFPYYLAVQNGAIILEMPSQRILNKKYLDQEIIPVMQEICNAEPTDFVIFAGCEYNDVSYYRPHCFSEEMLNYVHQRKTAFKEDWKAVESFEQTGLRQFPSVKSFGTYARACELAKRIESQLGLHVPVIRDPFNNDFYVVQATHPEVNKGQALRDLTAQLGQGRMIIAAGDDLNDSSMLAMADVRIVMETAPPEMLLSADIIAPSAAHQGIIKGLQTAIQYRRKTI